MCWGAPSLLLWPFLSIWILGSFQELSLSSEFISIESASQPAKYVTFRIPAAAARIKIHSLRFINSLTKRYKDYILLWVPGLFLIFISLPFWQHPFFLRADSMWKVASLPIEWWTHEWPVFIIDKPMQLPLLPLPSRAQNWWQYSK